MKYKVSFPGGYIVTDIENDNIDIHVILPNNRVYFGTLFTLENVKSLMVKDSQSYFWAIDMLLITDLSKRTIYQIIEKIIDEETLTTIFSEIGTIKDIYGKYQKFEDIPFQILNVI